VDIFVIGWMPQDNECIRLNRAFYFGANILKFVVVSAAEAELGTHYHNRQKKA
jgi:hypothetical protein